MERKREMGHRKKPAIRSQQLFEELALSNIHGESF